jgi:hypothetical protein
MNANLDHRVFLWLYAVAKTKLPDSHPDCAAALATFHERLRHRASWELLLHRSRDTAALAVACCLTAQHVFGCGMKWDRSVRADSAQLIHCSSPASCQQQCFHCDILA